MANRDKGIVYNDENITLGDDLDRWLADSVRGTVRESTFSRDKYLVSNHIKPALGRLKLKNLNALQVQSLYRDRLDSGLSGSTVQKIHHVLHKALAQAVRWDLIPRNPSDNVKAPTPTPKEMHPLSATEAQKLLEVAQGDRLEALYVLAIHTGMRQGELLGLRWEDVDLDRQSLRIRRTVTRKGNESGAAYGVGKPKTKKSRRTVRLTERAVEACRSHRARQAEVVGGGLLPKLWPEQVHHLLAVEAVRGSQGQELYEARRFPQTPGVLAYGAPLHRHPEAAQHPDTHGLGTPTNGAVLASVHATNLA